MSKKADILFITRLESMHDTGSSELYSDLRLEIMGYPAMLPLARALAQGGAPEEVLPELKQRMAKLSTPPFLTPILLREAMTRRNVTLVDVPCLPRDFEMIKEIISDGVGIIALSTTWLLGMKGAESVRQAAAKIREVAPEVPIVAGGVCVRKGLRARRMLKAGELSCATEAELADKYLLIDAARDSDLDAIIVSEGAEDTLAAVAQRVRDGRDFRDLPNLALPGDGGYQFTATVPEPTNLDEEIVDWSKYTERIQGFETPVRTTVGCPYKCQFCDFTGLYKPRVRAIDSLMAELQTLAQSMPAPGRIFFTDDNIALSKARLKELTDAFIKHKLGIEWRGFLRADIIDREMAERMRDSGCRECLLGIESADPGVLENMDKRLDPEKALDAIRYLDANGIRTQCTFVVGFPGENERSIKNTSDFLSALPSGESAGALHRYYLFPFQVSPLSAVATPLGRDKFGLQGLGEVWSHDTMDSDGAAAAVKEIFLNVTGPTHMYLEHLPPEWPLHVTRQVLEAREKLKKQEVCGALDNTSAVAHLLGLVRQADSNT